MVIYAVGLHSTCQYWETENPSSIYTIHANANAFVGQLGVNLMLLVLF